MKKETRKDRSEEIHPLIEYNVILGNFTTKKKSSKLLTILKIKDSLNITPEEWTKN